MRDLIGIPSYSFDFGTGITTPSGIVIRHASSQGSHSKGQLEYRFKDIALAQMGVRLAPEYADLLDVACAVSVADRWSPRSVPGDTRSPGNRWHRRMSLTIPVRNMEVWASESVREDLAFILGYLTDDQWSIEFVPRTLLPRASEMQTALEYVESTGAEIASLFSGGLDSCIGLINDAQSTAADSLIAVSVVSSHRLQEVQSKVIDQLRSHIRPDLVLLHVEMGLAGGHHNRDARESTQRSRGFLYLAVGSLVSMICGAKALHLCENGIGAINLPYDFAQTGAHNTKAVHPRTIQLFGTLISKVLGVPVHIQNSGLWLTKAQLCSEFLWEGVYPAAKSTVTCDRFPWINPESACGKCTSCLLRRASLTASGHGAVDTLTYAFDPLEVGSLSSSRHESLSLHAMWFQVERLKALVNSTSPEDSLLDEFPELLDAVVSTAGSSMSQAEVAQKLTALYRVYVSEWDYFTSRLPSNAESSTAKLFVRNNKSVLASAS